MGKYKDEGNVQVMPIEEEIYIPIKIFVTHLNIVYN